MDDTLVRDGGELRLRARLTAEQVAELRTVCRAVAANPVPKPDRVRRQPLTDVDPADLRRALAQADQQMEQIEADAVRREEALRQSPAAPPDDAAVAAALAALRQTLAAAAVSGITIRLGKARPAG